MSPLTHGIMFLTEITFYLFIFALMIRLLIPVCRLDFRNPLVQSILMITNFVIAPLARFLPNISGIETATLLVILMVSCLKATLLMILGMGYLNLIWIPIIGVVSALRVLLDIFFIAIIITVITSWIQASQFSTIVNLFTAIANPILRPLRAIIPMFGALDLSPIAAIILIKFVDIVFLLPFSG